MRGREKAYRIEAVRPGGKVEILDNVGDLETRAAADLAIRDLRNSGRFPNGTLFDVREVPGRMRR
jgi:hypothetical protein